MDNVLTLGLLLGSLDKDRQITLRINKVTTDDDGNHHKTREDINMGTIGDDKEKFSKYENLVVTTILPFYYPDSKNPKKKTGYLLMVADQ